MKRKFISKIIAGTLISTTLCTLTSVRASAEWVNDYQGNWYYLQDNQKMTGWKRIDGQLYYFDDNGKMQTGWIEAGTSWYFLQKNGVLKTGWINYNNKWYYADSSGVIQTGIINISGRVYIFDNNGVMKTSNAVINGQFYTIGLNGEVVGSKVPTPNKEFDSSGNCIEVLNNADDAVITSPTNSSFNEVIKDQSQSDDDPNEGRTFKVKFKDSNGSELKVKSVKNGKSIDLYEPTKEGYNFAYWNTKSDGSGKSYSINDEIKVKEDINLYAQWSENTAVYVEKINIKGSSYVAVSKTVQMTAEVLPSDATNTNVIWSVTDGTGKATIDDNGVLTGVSGGKVTVKATAQDGSKVSATKEITVSATDVVVPVNQITVNASSGVFAIKANGGTLQMKASVLPADASNQGIIWSVENRTGSASIDSNGLVKAISNGTVTVKATAKDGSGVVGSTTIEISGQITKILVSSITVSGESGASTIETDGGKLQMIANVLPTTASNKSVTWTVEKVGDANTTMTGNATISANGLLTAIADGTVKVRAIAKDGTGFFGEKVITISNQNVNVTKITVSGAGDAAEITTDAALGGTNGILQMNANITPDIATNKNVTWSVEIPSGSTGSAKISTTGLLTAITNGDVVVKATAADGSKVVGTKTIKISGQSVVVAVSSITVNGENDASSISTDDGTLQMMATVLPSTTTSQAVTWSVSSGTGTATISTTGLLKAVSNGTVIVKATSVKYPNIVGTKTITLRGQFIQAERIDVSSSSAINKVEVDGTLQMSANVLPANATKKTVTWSVDSVAGSTGSATINATTGVLTGKSVGKVMVIATAADGAGAVGSKEIEVIPQVKVTSIGVKGTLITDGSIGITQITTDKGSIQMTAAIDPNNATNQGVTWSVEQAGDAGTTMTGKATIDSNTGVLTAVADGTVKVKATAKDGSGIVGSEVITISGQIVKATGYTVKGFTGTTETTKITSDKGTITMIASIIPNNATIAPAVTWSVEQAGDTGTIMTGKATIDSNTGVLTAAANGTVRVKAVGTTSDGTVINGTAVITIIGQIVNVTEITVTALSDKVAVGNVLQMTANILPTTASDKSVIWSVISGTGSASIGSDGKLAGETKGTVTVKATSKDGSGISGTKIIVVN